jgi:transcriptional regulator with XRE-family HTH domain
MTQEAIAHEAGITSSTLSVIERGESNPTWATVARIAAAIDVSMVEIAKATKRLEV